MMKDKNMILREIKNYSKKLQNDTNNGNYKLSDNAVNNVIDMFDKIDFNFYDYLIDSYIYDTGYIKDTILIYLDGFLFFDRKNGFNDITMNDFKDLEDQKNSLDVDMYTLNNMIKRFKFVKDKNNNEFVYMQDSPVFWYTITKLDLLNNIKIALDEIKKNGGYNYAI